MYCKVDDFNKNMGGFCNTCITKAALVYEKSCLTALSHSQDF